MRDTFKIKPHRRINVTPHVPACHDHLMKRAVPPIYLGKVSNYPGRGGEVVGLRPAVMNPGRPGKKT